jgi:hypothetical protein
MEASHGEKIGAGRIRSDGKSEFRGHKRTNHLEEKKTMENVRGQGMRTGYPLFLTARENP